MIKKMSENDYPEDIDGHKIREGDTIIRGMSGRNSGVKRYLVKHFEDYGYHGSWLNARCFAIKSLDEKVSLCKNGKQRTGVLISLHGCYLEQSSKSKKIESNT